MKLQIQVLLSVLVYSTLFHEPRLEGAEIPSIGAEVIVSVKSAFFDVIGSKDNAQLLKGARLRVEGFESQDRKNWLQVRELFGAKRLGFVRATTVKPAPVPKAEFTLTNKSGETARVRFWSYSKKAWCLWVNEDGHQVECWQIPVNMTTVFPVNSPGKYKIVLQSKDGISTDIGDWIVGQAASTNIPRHNSQLPNVWLDLFSHMRPSRSKTIEAFNPVEYIDRNGNVRIEIPMTVHKEVQKFETYLYAEIRQR